MTPDELVDAVCTPIHDIAWAFFFAPETAPIAQRHDLDPITFYFIGRGGVLGDVEASVVAAVFGVLQPDPDPGHVGRGSSQAAPRDAGRAYFEAAAQYGRLKLAGIDGLDRFCAAADTVMAAADPTGLALYVAVAAEPLVDDPAGRALQQLHVLRELRAAPTCWPCGPSGSTCYGPTPSPGPAIWPCSAGPTRTHPPAPTPTVT